MIKIHTYLYLAIICSATPSTCPAQKYPGGNLPVVPATPEYRAAAKRIAALYATADHLRQSRQFRESITAYRLAIDADISLNTFRNLSGSGYYGLALAYTELNRSDEALDAYRLAFNSKALPGAELQLNRPGGVAPYMKYAVLLARAGRKDDAKMVYYAGIRTLHRKLVSKNEPIPFNVVFDPDPEATVWNYSPQNLELAARMAEALFQGYEGQKLAEEIHRAKPDWYLPVLLQASETRPDDAEPLYAEADRLAKTEAEREVVRKVRAWRYDNYVSEDHQPGQILGTLEWHRDSQVLREWQMKLEAKENWDSIATERK